MGRRGLTGPCHYPRGDRRRELLFRSGSRSGRDNCVRDHRTGGADGTYRDGNTGTGRVVQVHDGVHPGRRGAPARRTADEAHGDGHAAVRRGGLRPGEGRRARGRGGVDRLCGGGGRGGHGGRARRLVRGHGPLPAPARAAHPAHRDHPHQEGPAGRLARRVRRGELPLRGRRTAAAARGRHRQPARGLAGGAGARGPGDGGTGHRPARGADRAARLGRAGGRRRGDQPAGRRAGDRAGHRQDAGEDRRRRRAPAGGGPGGGPRARLAGAAPGRRDGGRGGRRARLDPRGSWTGRSASGSTRSCCGSSPRCGTCPRTRRAARSTASSPTSPPTSSPTRTPGPGWSGSRARCWAGARCRT